MTDFHNPYRLNTYQMEAVLDESPACVVNANVGSGQDYRCSLRRSCTCTLRRQVPLRDMVVLTFTKQGRG